MVAWADDTYRAVMEGQPKTPAELSRELGVSDKWIRAALRQRYGRVAERGENRWRLNDEQVRYVRERLRRRRR